MITGAVDISGFSRFVQGLENALIGTGQDGDLHAVVKSETALLAWEISTEIGPKTLEAGEKHIRADAKHVVTPGPAEAFPQGKRKPLYGETNVTWLYAGPSFLVGVRDENLQMSAGVSELSKRIRSEKKSGFPRGKAFVAAGARGKQKVVLINRLVIGKRKLRELLESYRPRIGRLRAMFAYAADQLGKKNIPAWLKNLFPAVKTDGAAIFRITGSGAMFAIEFGARAPGVASNQVIVKKFRRAIDRRQHLISAKTEKLLSGYAYDWNTGRVFRKNRGEEMLRELEHNEEVFNSL